MESTESKKRRVDGGPTGRTEEASSVQSVAQPSKPVETVENPYRKKSVMNIVVVEGESSSSANSSSASQVSKMGPPRLPLDPDTKVPYPLRQRTLTLIYNQLTRLKAVDASERALRKERELHQMSDKHTYQTNAASMLVTLRKATQLPPDTDADNKHVIDRDLLGTLCCMHGRIRFS